MPPGRAQSPQAGAARAAKCFRRPTTNGGVVPPPVHVPEPLAAVAPVEPVEAFEAAPAITPLEGETFQVAAAGQQAASEGGAPPAAPMQRSQRPPFRNRRPRPRARRLWQSRWTAADATAAGDARPGTRRTRPPARARFAAVQIRFACRIRDRRASRSLTNRLPRISSRSFCRASRSQNSRIAFRPLLRRLQLKHPSSLRRGNFRRAACAADVHGRRIVRGIAWIRCLRLRRQRFLKSTKLQRRI